MNKKFTYSCFIRKNTKELRDKLEELGYKVFGNISVNSLFTHEEGYVIMSNLYNINKKYLDSINCGENEQLFLALAALNDIDDYMQWFINVNGDFFLCLHKYVKLCVNVAERKANPEELIEHFKNS